MLWKILISAELKVISRDLHIFLVFGRVWSFLFSIFTTFYVEWKIVQVRTILMLENC